MTSPFRTIFDLAAVLEMRELERAFHEAEVRGVTDRISLPVLLERYPGGRGPGNCGRYWSRRSRPRSRGNDFEEAFLALVGACGLHRPRMNADLSVRGRFFRHHPHPPGK